MKNQNINITCLLIYLSVTLIVISSCNHSKPEKNSPLKIAISKGKGSEGYEQYGKWLTLADSTVEYFDLYFISLDSALDILEGCDGLLLTGGPDVNPAHFNRIDDTIKCGIRDHRRDTLEYKLIEKALKKNMPILGICRGEQFFNVSQEGSLIVDIPTDFDTMVIHRCPDPNTCFHDVKVKEGSLLFEICKVKTGIINTNHHQAAQRLGKGLKAIAWANDSLIEAIQWSEPEGKSFFLGVQWHPEKMDTTYALSFPIAKYFLKEAKKFNKIK